MTRVVLGANRTRDLSLRRRPLYPLSYEDERSRHGLNVRPVASEATALSTELRERGFP